MAPIQGRNPAAGPPFNCAAPFRERLSASMPDCYLWRDGLQLCRPLSGAVISFIVTIRLSGPAGFNCAAPFRERLCLALLLGRRPVVGLQLCRPLSGAVISNAHCQPYPHPVLQLCRPLSGAVIRGIPGVRHRVNSFNCAAPFRERLCAGRQMSRRPSGRASIVPPPFGSGYSRWPRTPESPGQGFNCAAPFRERL